MSIQNHFNSSKTVMSSKSPKRAKILDALAITYIIAFIFGIFWMGFTAAEEDVQKNNLVTVNEIAKNYVGAVPVDNSFTFKQIDGQSAFKNNYFGVGEVKFATETRECTFLLNAKTMTCRGGIPEVTVKE